jgi:hypothetical protein
MVADGPPLVNAKFQPSAIRKFVRKEDKFVLPST